MYANKKEFINRAMSFLKNFGDYQVRYLYAVINCIPPFRYSSINNDILYFKGSTAIVKPQQPTPITETSVVQNSTSYSEPAGVTEANATSNIEQMENPSRPAVAPQPKPKPVCIIKLQNIHNDSVCMYI